MDKYEYKVRSEEIKELISRKEYVQAAEIADTIDWRRVKSVMMLCTISDLYKINRRYEDSYDLLLLAYDRHPGGRTIVYALCELSIKMGNVIQAWEYYKEYLQIAPKDVGRYILQYKIYVAEEVNLEERVAVLEELKKRDYREKWAYELAYLYHRIGLASKCVDECDEMIAGFGEGKYVIKAMELKMLHQPLSPQQQVIYDNRFAPVAEEAEPVEEVQEAEPEEVQAQQAPATTTTWSGSQVASAEGLSEVEFAQTKRIANEEIDITVKTIDPSKPGDTINLSEHIRAGLQEILEDNSPEAAITRAIIAPMLETDRMNHEAVEENLAAQSAQNEGESANIQPAMSDSDTNTDAPTETLDYVTEAEAVQQAGSVAKESIYTTQEEAETAGSETAEAGQAADSEAAEEARTENVAGCEAKEQEAVDAAAVTVMEQLRQEETGKCSKEMEQNLSMEADGQISFVMPEKEKIEKQITGQISIADIMAEWDRKKKEIEEKNKQKLIQSVKHDTDKMFTDFEASMRDGLLEQLERGRDLEQVIAQAEGKYVDEDGVLIPPSLVEDATEEAAGEEGSLEDYEAVSFEEATQAVDKSVRFTSAPEQDAEDEAGAQEVIEEAPVAEEYAQEAAENEAQEQEAVEEAFVAEEYAQEAAENEAQEQEAVEEAFVAEEYAQEAAEDEAQEQEAVEEAFVAEEFAQEAAEDEAQEQEAVEEAFVAEGFVQEAENETEVMEEAVTEETSEDTIEQMVEAVLAADDEVEELIEIEDLSEESEEKSDEEVAQSAEVYSEDDAQRETFEEETFEEQENDFSEIDAAYEAALLGAAEDTANGKSSGIDYDTISMPAGEVEAAINREKMKLRNLTREERELFSPYIQGRSSKAQLVQTIDNISMAAYTGNVIITGAEGLDTLGLARDLIRNVQLTDSNFSGKIAKISGESLNKRDVSAVMEGLDNGALIIQKAPSMKPKTVEALHKALQQEHMGIVVIMEGTKKAMNAFLEKNAKLHTCFTGRIDMEALSDAALVSFGKKYAREKEYAIDELSGLALSKRIAERQTSDHAVTILEVKEIVDAAIESANRKTLGHFLDVLMAKRYDDEDMIIIKEKDFR